jgi:hypothetical protein
VLLRHVGNAYEVWFNGTLLQRQGDMPRGGDWRGAGGLRHAR